MISIVFDETTKSFSAVYSDTDPETDARAERKRKLKKGAKIAAGVAGAAALGAGAYYATRPSKKGVVNTAKQHDGANNANNIADATKSTNKLTEHLNRMTERNVRRGNDKRDKKNKMNESQLAQSIAAKQSANPQKAADIVRKARAEKEKTGHGFGFTARPSDWMTRFKNDAKTSTPGKYRMTPAQWLKDHKYYSKH